MRLLPPLNGIRAFEAAARHESFSRAADELHVTPAAISQQVKALEAWLEVQLFERKARGLALTQPGRQYLSRLSDILDRLAEATETVKNAASTSIFTVSCTPGFAAMFLAPRLWSFAKEHPDLDIRISATDRAADFVRDGIDVAIRYGHRGDPGLVSELLVKDVVTPVCAPSLLEGKHPLRTPEDLKYHVLLHNDSPVVANFRMDWEDWLRAAEVQGVAAHRGLHFSDTSMVIQEAIAGRGVALGHTALLGEQLRTGRLVRPFELGLAGLSDYYIVHPLGAEKQPKVAAFLDWIREQVRKDAVTDAPERDPAPAA